VLLAVLAAAAALVSLPASAQEGDEPPCRERCFTPSLPIDALNVEATVRDQLADVEVSQLFRNPNDFPIEATFLFPLPADAAVSGLTMTVDGEQLEGRLLDAGEARGIYEEIVRQRLDPALLEFVDDGLYQTSVFPIPAGGERRLVFGYSQVLEAESGLTRLSLPLRPAAMSGAELASLAITVNVESSEGLSAVYSPTHDVAVLREGDDAASVSFEASNLVPEADFELLYSASEGAIGLDLANYRLPGEDGYFLMLVSPALQARADEVVKKDVVIVFDTSGSMEGEKMQQAKDAASYVVEHLNPADRLGIVSFDSSVRVWEEGLQPAEGSRQSALDFIASEIADGSTNIHDALMAGLGMVAGGERPAYVLFLTDGLATVGVQDPAEITAAVSRAADANVRLFSFGVGYDVHTFLLDQIAQEQRGLSEYVAPEEDVTVAVSAFYERVSDPVLSDVTLEVEGAEVYDLQPGALPDLFAGQQLAVLGRYQGDGAARVTLSGSLNGEPVAHTYTTAFAERASEVPAIARLWATRKIGFLLNSIRLEGENQEVVEEIVDLATRFGIVTPYTSFLVEEPGLALDSEGAANAFRDEAVPDLDAAGGAADSGATAVAAAQSVAELGEATAQAMSSGAEGVMQVAGGKAFYLVDEVWTDALYEDGETVKLGYGSEAYFDALSERPDWGAYFALGERVIFVEDGVAYEVAEGAFPAPDLESEAAAVDPTAQPESEPAVAVAPAESDSTEWLWIVAGVVGGLAAAGLLVFAGWRGRRRVA
jgi:Ca-activated chloride channel family protein